MLVKKTVLLLVSLILIHLLGVKIYAQDGDDGSGSIDVSVDNQFDNPSEGNSIVDEPVTITDDQRDSNPNRDSWATDKNFHAADDVNQAAYAESRAYQDLYSYEAEHGMDGSPEHQALQEAAARASAGTQIAQDKFDNVQSNAVDESASLQSEADKLSKALEAIQALQDPDKPAGEIQAALSGIPGNFRYDQIAAIIGGTTAITDPKTAGVLAAQLVESRGGNLGDRIGAYVIAEQTSLGSRGTGTQITLDTIANTYSPGVNGLEFAQAIFATAKTFGADLTEVTSKLNELGLNQENIITAAVRSGIPPGDLFSPGAPAARDDQKTRGPSPQIHPGSTDPAAAPIVAPPPAPAPNQAQSNPQPAEGVNADVSDPQGKSAGTSIGGGLSYIGTINNPNPGSTSYVYSGSNGWVTVTVNTWDNGTKENARVEVFSPAGQLMGSRDVSEPPSGQHINTASEARKGIPL